MLALHPIIIIPRPVTPVITFPRPELFEDLDLDVGGFAALLGTAFEKLFKGIDVVPVAVGEGRERSVPDQINEFRAAEGEAQDVGGS